MRSSSFTLAAALAVAVPRLAAQELIAVNFQGLAFGVDLTTGVGRTIGSTGVTGCNAMATQGGVLYSTAQTGGTSGPRQLVSIDPITAKATVLFPNIGVDLRGLCSSQTPNQLFGIADGATDRLVRIDVVTGQVTTVGNTGLTSIQALESNEVSGTLFAWDLTLGLVSINTTTGVATDVNPSVGAQNVGIQFLTLDPNQRLIGGQNSLFEINRQTGVVTQIGTSTNLADLRGAEVHVGRAAQVGVGCPTVSVPQAALSAKSTFLAGSSVTMFSTSHQANAVGVVLVGVSTTTYQGIPLPFDLDLLLGTVGCKLFVSPDLSLPVKANAAGAVLLNFNLPSVRGATLHFQCATLEAVVGGLSATNGFTIQTPL